MKSKVTALHLGDRGSIGASNKTFVSEVKLEAIRRASMFLEPFSLHPKQLI